MFGERLAALVAERQSQLVVGIDPDPGALWPLGPEPGSSARAPRASAAQESGAVASADPGLTGGPARRMAEAVHAHCEALIDAVAPAALGVKFQLACFERLQAAGWQVLAQLAGSARARGLLVIADGKRGDIPVSSAAYAQALFGGLGTPYGQIDGLGADLVTVNPLMGADAIAPFLEAARSRGGGALALVRTSNPGARDVQDLSLADGRPLWERLAELVDALGAGAPVESGRERGDSLSDLGAVVGATAPAHLVRARELMPRAVFLAPGIGAQGGRVEELSGAFASLAGPARRASVLVTAARSVADAHLSHGGAPAAAARAEAERLRAAAWEL
ncbi:MAG: orotidine-5'-phosphate decarboxylase [Acidobacteriota bacterium]|nr:orotidine-5'-phosphate decarboxylase [Acidobacteriota bacterium]